MFRSLGLFSLECPQSDCTKLKLYFLVFKAPDNEAQPNFTLETALASRLKA